LPPQFGSGTRPRRSAATEKESGLKLQVLRTDNGDKFTALEFVVTVKMRGSSATTPKTFTPGDLTCLLEKLNS
jgi:hypothetical protein